MFGMNLGGIPLADHWSASAWSTLDVTVAAVLVLYRSFKRADWL